MTREGHDYDWIVIGSGFGGSVAALRLAEKGYRVAVLEQGRRFGDLDFASSAWQVRRLIWAPRLALRGIMKVTPLRHVTLLSGVGVGGGSLVYGNTLYRPRSDAFYRHPQWAGLAEWRAELDPHFAEAERMLGAVDYVGGGASERLMRELAGDLGVADSYHPTRVGVYFGEPGVTVADPYFGGRGPARTGCVRCGQCLLGCRYGAKNTLLKNYLWHAEALGVEILSDHRVTDVRPRGPTDGSTTPTAAPATPSRCPSARCSIRTVDASAASPSSSSCCDIQAAGSAPTAPEAGRAAP